MAALNDWNDRVDPQWRDKVSKYDRVSALPVMLPPDKDGAVNYFVLPVSWGLKPIKVALDYALDAASGHGKSPGDTIGGVTSAALEAYNPVGGTDVVSALTPSPIDLPVDIGRNVSWSGAKIRPDWNRFEPRSSQYFAGLEKGPSGRLAIAGTERLSGAGIEVSPADVKYAYDTLVGGAGRTASKFIDTITSIAQLEEPDIRSVPFASRFVRKVGTDEIQRRMREKAQEQQRAEREVIERRRAEMKRAVQRKRQ
jgi:hypothetical protein